jgi:metal-sulfur cluster biosynthetic enzyme
MSSSSITETAVMAALREVIDPELGCNIVDLGLIYSMEIDGGRVRVVMTLTTPGCPMQQTIRSGVEYALLGLEGVEDAEVEVAFDPPWNPSMMTDAGRARTGVRNY